MNRTLAPPGTRPLPDGDRAPDAGLPSLGTVVGGRYRILREIGRGGMGVVYEATHCVTDVHFALKILLPEVCAASDAERRFVREVKVGGRIKHKNLVSAYDAGLDGAWLFMVMELLHGESLEQRLKRQTRLPLETCVRILAPCMRGVMRAHAANIVHRDLKPANIFLCQPDEGEAEEQPRVLDFGVLSDIGFNMNSWVTSRGIPIGTPPYMSVEQLRATGATPQFDVHAFGVILYQTLSGQLPFMADTLQDLIVQINTHTPTPLDRLGLGLSPEIAEVAARAMSRDVAQQFGSLSEMLDALLLATRRPVIESPPRALAPARAERRPRPRFRLYAMLAASALGVAAIYGGSLIARGSGRADSRTSVHVDATARSRGQEHQALAAPTAAAQPGSQDARPSTRESSERSPAPADLTAEAGLDHERAAQAAPASSSDPKGPLPEPAAAAGHARRSASVARSRLGAQRAGSAAHGGASVTAKVAEAAQPTATDLRAHEPTPQLAVEAKVAATPAVLPASAPPDVLGGGATSAGRAPSSAGEPITGRIKLGDFTD